MASSERKHTKPPSPTPSMLTTAMRFSASRAPRIGFLASRAPTLIPKLFFSSLKSHKNDIAVKTKFTTREGHDGTGFSDGDILIFPEMTKYKGLKDSDVDSFVEDVMVNGKP